jgi:hypothetical protein
MMLSTVSPSTAAAMSAANIAALEQSRGTAADPGPDTTGAVVISALSFEENKKVVYERELAHRQNPIWSAHYALSAMRDELKNVDDSLSRERPSIDSGSWDLSLEDGRLTVSGSLGAEDQKWLEARLNGNEALKSAATTFAKAAVDYLQTSDDNPAYQNVNFITGHLQSYAFADVQGQLESTVQFKKLLSDVRGAHSSPGVTTTGRNLGYYALETLASQFSASPP